MKVVKKDDGIVIGVFNASNAEREVALLGYSVDECDFIQTQAEQDRENLLFIESTDWQVTRHRDQVAMGVETALTDEAYQELLSQRQTARDDVVDQDALVKYRQR
ncbi:hypothetical protein [Vibrio sp. ER1A]|uniref:hypothetical protein n=1 Tax=Vibrio sp. ER1A TaxID=1517681 RepID=UPI0004DCDA20|nr:hypothetical protein [Vibrio sp. ER1A]KFA98775.1 hypothetical protein HW45_07055 [Vibrio sp. ER1A]